MLIWLKGSSSGLLTLAVSLPKWKACSQKFRLMLPPHHLHKEVSTPSCKSGATSVTHLLTVKMKTESTTRRLISHLKCLQKHMLVNCFLECMRMFPNEPPCLVEIPEPTVCRWHSFCRVQPGNLLPFSQRGAGEVRYWLVWVHRTLYQNRLQKQASCS